jgi:NADP-dependent 3-hydroxy acid dehydrogenase YdfG
MTDAPQHTARPTTDLPAPRELGTVFITGGSSGLGAALVDAVTAGGGKPVVLDRVPPSADVPHAVVDLADSTAAAEAVEHLALEVGPPDAVVTAAGTDACGPLTEIGVDDWERVVRVNLLGTVAVVRAALPYLEERRGTVVTIASTLGLKGVSDATAYCASKFGVRGFSQALAAELSGRVGVTCLVSGGMRTAFFDGRAEQYKPGPDADLADPRVTAATIVTALRQPVGVEIREMLVAASGESSWP